MDSKKKSTILILVGVGVILVTVIFSDGHMSRDDGITDYLSDAEVVLLKGTYKATDYEYSDRLSFPSKYPLAIGVIIILVGVGKKVLAKPSAQSDD